MEYYFAPMEGVGGAIYRTAHHRYFSGVDKYYIPFITPTREHLFAPRDLRNVAPEYNQGVQAVPQLLTKDADDFCWAARSLYDMGYDEVNLNLGCPSGTVTAKGKGAGLLANLEGLERLLDGIYGQLQGAVSVKTRLGMTDAQEFHRLLELFGQYPISLLIVHPRVREDYYRSPIRMEGFAWAVRDYKGALCYNGGLTTPQACIQFSDQFPQVERMMLGRGLLTNPALVRVLKGGAQLERKELRAFHDQLYHTYLDAFQSGRNTVFHMKELWSYWGSLFGEGDKLLKQIRKAQDVSDYERAVEQIFNALVLKL